MNNIRWIAVLAVLATLTLAYGCGDDDTYVPLPDAQDHTETTETVGADADADADADGDLDVPPDETTGPVCGNGTCEAGETAATCPADCATAEGDLSCQMVVTCDQCCPSADEACFTACNAAGTADAQTQIGDYLACLSSRCATECGEGGSTEACSTCQTTNCSTEINACGVGAVGTTGCLTMAMCLQACPALPTAGSGSATSCPTNAGITCWNGCFVAADQNAVDLYLAAGQCQQTNCATECGPTGSTTACQTCFTTNCSAEMGACQSDS